MFDILTLVPGKKKHTSSGWYSFNAICCSHRGHRQDKRGRGGIKFEEENWSMHCFNCGFKCGFTLGKSISKNTRQFLLWCGLDETQIQRYSLESLQHKDLIEYVKIKKEKLKVKFKEHKLPDDAERLDKNNPKHKMYIDYLQKRKINYSDCGFMVTPNGEGRNNNRIIIPYTYRNKIVGQTSRFTDNKIPKFINEQQPGFVFGLDFQKPDREFVIVVEGIFDALSLGACAVMHNTINEDQALLIGSLNKRVIYVPDHDRAGFESIDRAIELGYHVSLPNWDKKVKDVNDAVVKYGKLATLLSIIQSASNNKVKIQIQRRKLEKIYDQRI